MPKRTEVSVLKDRVQERGFTPAVRDLPGLLSLLGDKDESLVRDVERALERVGAPAATFATVALPDASPPLRGRLCRLIGRFARSSESARSVLFSAIEDADPKTRRNAIVALGKLGPADPGVEAALLAAWAKDERVEHRRSIAEALGKVGAAPSLALLRTVRTEDKELGRLVERAVHMLVRETTRAERGSIDGSRSAAQPVSVVVHCRAGLEDVVREELDAKCGGLAEVEPETKGAPGTLRVKWRGPLEGLFAVRTFLHFGLFVPSGRHEALEKVAEHALASEEAGALLGTWTRGAVRFRLAWADGQHRRAATWRVVHALAVKRPAWINDPTASTWEAVVSQRGVELLPSALPDPRFAYRVRDVPAASHPTLAAALVRVGGVRADDVVWDPFMGSGTELVERARAGAYRALRGTDGDPAALDAARANFAAASLPDVSVTLADATSFAPEGVTLIVTNPPMGRRVARAASLPALFDRFLAHAARTLVPGGRLVWISPRPSQTAARGRELGLIVDYAKDVDMGGFTAQMQRMTLGRAGGKP